MRSSARSLSPLAPLAVLASLLLGAASSLTGLCGPFTDVAADVFCPFVLEIFYLGITTGTSATTYDPASNVTRLQMAAFLSRTVDRTLQRGNRRSAMDQFWTPQSAASLGLTTFIGGSIPQMCRFDGDDVWVANYNAGTAARVHASDGRILNTWTGASSAWGVLVAMGRIFISADEIPGKLYQIIPSPSPGAVTTVASNLGNQAFGIAFDGVRIWTADYGIPGAVSIVTPGASIPWTVTNVTTGFVNPIGALFDGSSVWITDYGAGTLLKLGSAAQVLQTVTLGGFPYTPIFDGSNIWVPNFSPPGSVSVVRASTGAILATLTGNGLAGPYTAAFDGQRILVTNQSGSSVSLWKAADFTPLGSVVVGTSVTPYGACSDGANFWITLSNVSQLLKF